MDLAIHPQSQREKTLAHIVNLGDLAKSRTDSYHTRRCSCGSHVGDYTFVMALSFTGISEQGVACAGRRGVA